MIVMIINYLVPTGSDGHIITERELTGIGFENGIPNYVQYKVGLCGEITACTDYFKIEKLEK